MHEGNIAEKDQLDFFNFINDFVDLIDVDEDGTLSDTEIEQFKKILNFSTITSAETQSEKRVSTRQITDNLEELIKQVNPEAEIIDLFKMYESEIIALSKEKRIVISKQYALGQTAASYYLETKTGKRRKF